MLMRLFRKKSILLHLAITIAVSITFIEVLIFIGSYKSQQDSLVLLRHEMVFEIAERMNVSPSEVDLNLLSKTDREKRMAKYSRNIFLLVASIIVFVVLSNILIVYFFVGRHLTRLHRMYLSSDHQNQKLYPEDDIPFNDLGDVLLERNANIREIAKYRGQLEERLDEAKVQLVHSAKLSAIGEFTSTIAHDLKNPITIIQGSLFMLKRQISKTSCSDEIKGIEKIEFA